MQFAQETTAYTVVLLFFCATDVLMDVMNKSKLDRFLEQVFEGISLLNTAHMMRTGRLNQRKCNCWPDNQNSVLKDNQMLCGVERNWRVR